MVINGYMNDLFNAYETGHCLDLDHSWPADPEVEHEDPRIQCRKEHNAPGWWILGRVQLEVV